MAELCANCDTPLLGPYCHVCGQPRRDGRLTLNAFASDVLRRVFRFDKAIAVTFWRMLRAPGVLVPDYLAGRRSGMLDPIHYFISSVFVQIVIAAFTQAVALRVDRASALMWVGQLGGFVAFKILIIFWMGTVWRVLFRDGRYNLAETYVFATYAFATTGLLWALLPVIDLIVPAPLGANAVTVSIVTTGIEVIYLTYAVASITRLALPASFVRVGAVLIVGYALLAVAVGVDRTITLLLPPLPNQE
jgi:hypothetical protein